MAGIQEKGMHSRTQGHNHSTRTTRGKQKKHLPGKTKHGWGVAAGPAGLYRKSRYHREVGDIVRQPAVRWLPASPLGVGNSGPEVPDLQSG